MKKIFIAALAGMLMLSGGAFAADNTSNDTQSDVNAIDKDNAAIRKHKSDLSRHRSQKAVDKANRNYGSEATDSAKIGADKEAIREKRMERSADQKILKHHQNQSENNNEDNMNATGRQ